MLKLKKINKNDYYALLIIAILFSLMLYISWLKWLHPIIDCGREVYIPWLITKGDILYKDIAFYYGPFAVYFIALLFKLFGASLTISYITGILVNIILCGTIYFLARQLLSPLESALMIAIYFQIGPFAPNLGSYEGFIFPYSFATLFATLFILLQIALIIGYLKHNNPFKLLYLSAIFSALTITCKQEYALSSLLISIAITIYLVKTNQSTKNIIYYWL
ncbi:MAG: hypothetical protein AB1782_10865, partial [Cyanobacteriota bacterium]